MQKYEPLGRKMLVKPLKEDNYKTSVGIELVQTEFMKAEIMEVSKECNKLFKKGEIVVISANAGIGQPYNGESCLWIDSRSAPEGDVWFIVREDKK